MKQITFFLTVAIVIFNGCDLAGPEERAIREMIKTFVVSIDTDNEELAFACLLDGTAFNILNPDARARSDSETYIDDFLAELIHSFRNLSERFKGKDVKFKQFNLGSQFYQYKGFSAFKNNEIVIMVDETEHIIEIGTIVRVGDRWRIIEFEHYED